MNKRTSTSYVMTIDPLSSGDAVSLMNVRATVRAVNALSKLTAQQINRVNERVGLPRITPTFMRVFQHARLGKNNPASYKYRTRNSYQSIAMADASRIDVYIYTR